MSRKQLYINGVGTGTYGIYISSDTYLNAPAPDLVAHPVPGRSGDLVQWNKRLNNIVRKFDCYIPDTVQVNFDGFKKMLYSNIGYVEITSDYESDTYQMGYLAEEIAAEPFLKDGNLRVTFSLYFSCKPQKYFKTNTYYSRLMPSTYYPSRMLPRTHPIIQDMLKNIPIDDLPDADAYGLLWLGSTHIAVPSTVTGAQITSSDYDGFAAVLIVEDLDHWNIEKFHEVVAYTNHGNVNIQSLSESITSASLFACLVFPIDAVGTVSAQLYDGSLNIYTFTLGSVINRQNSNAVGASYVVDLTCDYVWTGSADTTYEIADLAIAGSLNGKRTFCCFLEIDTMVFRNQSTSGSNRPVEIWFDSRDLSITASFNNGYPESIKSYVSMYGDPDGLADRLDVFWYHYRNNNRGYDPLDIQSCKFSPEWWKV